MKKTLLGFLFSQTFPPGSFINTSAIINESEIRFFFFPCAICLPLSFPPSAQARALFIFVILQLETVDGKVFA